MNFNLTDVQQDFQKLAKDFGEKNYYQLLWNVITKGNSMKS